MRNCSKFEMHHRNSIFRFYVKTRLRDFPHTFSNIIALKLKMSNEMNAYKIFFPSNVVTEINAKSSSHNPKHFDDHIQFKNIAKTLICHNLF